MSAAFAITFSLSVKLLETLGISVNSICPSVIDRHMALFNSTTLWPRIVRERHIGTVEPLNLHLVKLRTTTTGLNLFVDTEADAVTDASRGAVSL